MRVPLSCAMGLSHAMVAHFRDAPRHDGQAEASGFRGKKRLKHFCARVGRDSGASSSTKTRDAFPSASRTRTEPPSGCASIAFTMRLQRISSAPLPRHARQHRRRALPVPGARGGARHPRETVRQPASPFSAAFARRPFGEGFAKCKSCVSFALMRSISPRTNVQSSQIGRQIRILQLHLQDRLHRAGRIAQIVRHSRRHLAEHREALALGRSRSRRIFFGSTAEVDHGRQLLGGEIRGAAVVSPVIQTVVAARAAQFLRAPSSAGCARRAPARPGDCERRRNTSRGHPHRRQTEFVADVALGARKKLRHVAMPSLPPAVRPRGRVDALAKRPMSAGPIARSSSCRTECTREQHACRRLRRKHGREPPADPVHEREIQQRVRRKRIHQVPLRSVLEEIVLEGEVDHQRPRKDSADDVTVARRAWMAVLVRTSRSARTVETETDESS